MKANRVKTLWPWFIALAPAVILGCSGESKTEDRRTLTITKDAPATADYDPVDVVNSASRETPATTPPGPQEPAVDAVNLAPYKSIPGAPLSPTVFAALGDNNFFLFYPNGTSQAFEGDKDGESLKVEVDTQVDPKDQLVFALPGGGYWYLDLAAGELQRVFPKQEVPEPLVEFNGAAIGDAYTGFSFLLHEEFVKEMRSLKVLALNGDSIALILLGKLYVFSVADGFSTAEIILPDAFQSTEAAAPLVGGFGADGNPWFYLWSSEKFYFLSAVELGSGGSKAWLSKRLKLNLPTGAEAGALPPLLALRPVFDHKSFTFPPGLAQLGDGLLKVDVFGGSKSGD